MGWKKESSAVVQEFKMLLRTFKFRAMVRDDGFKLSEVPVICRTKMVVLAAVKDSGTALQFAPEALRNDRSIVLAAVQQDGAAFQYASDNLRRDPGFALEAVEQATTALQYPDSTLCSDRNFVLAAVMCKGYSLQFASSQLQKDEEIGKIAVESYPLALEYASEKLRSNRSIVMEAVEKDGSALQFASPQLQNDEEIGTIAVKSYPLALEYASEKVCGNSSIVMEAVKSEGSALQFVSPQLQNDKGVVLAAVKANPDAIKYAHSDIKRDSKVLKKSGMIDKTTERKKIARWFQRHPTKIVLSTRFSLDPSSRSDATVFTKLFKDSRYIERGNFKVYAPNAYDKMTCDPNWTDFQWPCRGTEGTCRFENTLNKNGHPTDDCCWRYSFRYQLEMAKKRGGFMLQYVENGGELGKGQAIELGMARDLGVKVFQVHGPPDLGSRHVDVVIAAIEGWYEGWCRDMSVCCVRPMDRKEHCWVSMGPVISKSKIKLSNIWRRQRVTRVKAYDSAATVDHDQTTSETEENTEVEFDGEPSLLKSRQQPQENPGSGLFQFHKGRKGDEMRKALLKQTVSLLHNYYENRRDGRQV